MTDATHGDGERLASRNGFACASGPGHGVFHWPERLAVERVHVGIAEVAAAALVLAIAAAVLVLTGFVVLA